MGMMLYRHRGDTAPPVASNRPPQHITWDAHMAALTELRRGYEKKLAAAGSSVDVTGVEEVTEALDKATEMLSVAATLNEQLTEANKGLESVSNDLVTQNTTLVEELEVMEKTALDATELAMRLTAEKNALSSTEKVPSSPADTEKVPEAESSKKESKKGKKGK